MFAKDAVCTRCKRTYSLEKIVYTCESCDATLDVRYDYDALKGALDKSDLPRRRIFSIWRYREFLPINDRDVVSLGEGFTPLVKAERLQQFVGVNHVHLKLDHLCPTGSFKDRGSSVVVSKAKSLGAKNLVIDSSGNASASLAAYASRAELACYVFAPESASPEKLNQAVMGGARLVKVKGTRKEVYDFALAAYRKFGWYYCGFQSNPFPLEGMKTIGYEIAEQMNWEIPDWFVLPVGAGNSLLGCWKALKELREIGWIDSLPRLACIQAEGCAPLVKAFRGEGSEPETLAKSTTIAEGLLITDPLRSDLIIGAIKESRGLADRVSDDEILRAGVELARREGYFVEPSAAACIAGLAKAAASGTIAPDDRVVCLLTGTGLKSSQGYVPFLTPGSIISARPEELEKLRRWV